MRDLSLLLELFRDYYVKHDTYNKYGIFYVLYHMYNKTQLNFLEYQRLRTFFEFKFLLNDLEVQVNIDWLQSKINLLKLK